MLQYVLLMIPVALLMFSVVYAIRSVKSGKRTPKRAFSIQIMSFVAIAAVSFCFPFVTAAAEPSAVAAVADNSKGLGLIAAALCTSLSGIGGGIAVAASAPAAIGATSEDPKAFGKALIFVALGEGIALYGLLISFLILGKI